MSIAIKVENLSKAYQLGQIGTGTLSRDLERWWASVRGKEDPLLKIGEIKDRTVLSESNVVWSLKNIDFEIEQGDAVGIIGRNGAGKSTLLKLLSQITAPTSGIIKARGRIASLLEVGTGFHPELTGKENIYLNGAILGMRKREITRKLDEIIEFSGVERYVDTPVKRYSSGMYVRLAFAVAAHLDSEILIIDEVLAVGDAEFQKKCLGKLGDVSKGEGRTVLFVSHNMAAIQKLCRTGIFLKNGLLHNHDSIVPIIDDYLKSGLKSSSSERLNLNNLTDDQKECGYSEEISIEDLYNNPLEQIPVGKYWQVRIKFRINKRLEHFIIAIGCNTAGGTPIFTTFSNVLQLVPGTYEVVFKNNQFFLATGHYTINLGLSNYEKPFEYFDEAISLKIVDIKDESVKDDDRIVRNSGIGIILNPLEFSIIKN